MIVNCGVSVGLVAVTPHRVFPVAFTMFTLGVLYTSSYTMYYLLPMNGVGENELPLAIALINGVQLLAASVLPYFFALVVETLGYSMAWLMLALVGVLSLLVVSRINSS